MMKTLKLTSWLFIAAAVLLVFSITPTTATPKYAKETGKKCLDCHVKIPKKGEDPQLTELGKKFAENGHKLLQ